MPSYLLDLAPELLALVAEQLVEDHETLRELALASRKLQDIAEKVLYRDIFFQTSLDCTALHQSLEVRSARLASISSLDARCVDRIDHLSDVISKAKNLRTLIIESPVCNYGRWRYNNTWRELMPQLFAPLAQSAVVHDKHFSAARPLQRLKRLTLHWNGDKNRYWTIENDFSKLFALPALEELTLSCCTFPQEALAHVRGLPLTPLKLLELIECNINPSALQDILARPKALEQLYLGENRDHLDDPRPAGMYNSLCSRHLNSFFSALRQQEGSLCHISYRSDADTHDEGHRLPDSCASFMSFRKLKSFHLDGICSLMELVLADKQPPNLETIKVEGYHLEMADYPDLAPPGSNSEVTYRDSNHLHRISRRLSGIKSLRHVEVVMPQGDRTWDVHRQAMEAAIEEFDQKKVHVVLRRAPDYYSHVIPPYLYGESTPVPKVIYDSHVDGWVEEDDGSLADYMELAQANGNILDAFDSNDSLDEDDLDFVQLAMEAFET